MTVIPHVYTLTGNLLAEHTLEFTTWSPGGTFRAQRESFQVGGKGINVARMLTRLGVGNTALFFAGGTSGARCQEWLHTRGIETLAFATAVPTRQGLVVRSAAQRETTFLGPDVAPDAAAVAACAAFLDSRPGGEILAVCGSFPGWNDVQLDPLRDALARWLSRGTLVADTYGPPLAWMAEQPVELLKVNAAELRTIGLEAGPDLSLAALRYVITDGPRAVRLREAMSVEFELQPPAVGEISATGSGDVLFAVLIEALFKQRKSLRDAVSYALPFAAANAAHPGIAEFPIPG